VVLDPVGARAERMLAALVSGATLPALALLSGGEPPERMLELIAPALDPETSDAAPSVAVFGSGGTAVQLCALLAEHGVIPGQDADQPPYADAVVIVAHYVIPPADRTIWLQRDVPHLPVVYSDSGAILGPFIEPGRGPCLTCVELHHRDRDPAWPAIASQLLGRASSADHGALGAEVAATAARMLLRRLAGDPSGIGVAIRIDGETGERVESVIERHRQCACDGGGPLSTG